VTDPFRIIAIIAAYNEGDIIAAVIGHLVENGIDVYLLDDHSTDDTVAEAGRWLGRGLLHIEHFSPGPPTGPAPAAATSPPYDWTAILRRKEELAQELAADWFMHHDADEIRESPLPGLTLKEAIRWVDSLGYNCIDHVVLNFPPTDDGFRQGDDPRSYFRYFEESDEYDRVQLKTWRKTPQAVTLAASGGHQAEFEGRRVFPLPFLLRHYPVRGQTHGARKVFRERKGRFLEHERALGWHVQYDRIPDRAHTFTRDSSQLQRFDRERLRLDALLPDNAMRNLGERLLRADATLDVLRSQRQDLLRRLEEHREHAATLERERDHLARHAANLDAERAGLYTHAAALEDERAGLRQQVANQGRELDRLRRRVAERETLQGRFTGWRWTALLRRLRALFRGG
jgi:hypothetical protein